MVVSEWQSVTGRLSAEEIASGALGLSWTGRQGGLKLLEEGLVLGQGDAGGVLRQAIALEEVDGVRDLFNGSGV